MRPALAAVLLLVPVAGCDGGDSPPPSTAATSTTTAAPECPAVPGASREPRSLEPLGGPFRLEDVEVRPTLPGCLEQVVLTYEPPAGVAADDSALGYEVGAGAERRMLEVVVPNGRGGGAAEVKGEGASLVESVRREGRGRFVVALTGDHSFKVLVRGSSGERRLVVSVVR